MVWAVIGRPNQREWLATGRGAATMNDGLYPSGYYLFQAPATAPVGAGQARPGATSDKKPTSYESKLWKGWLLPASDADAWFVAGSAAYHRLLSADDLDKQIKTREIEYRGLKLAPSTDITRHRIEESKGVLWLDAQRRKMGDDAFFKLMSDYFAVNTTKTVTAQSFLDKAGVSFDFQEPKDGPAYLVNDINRRLESAILVYGTDREAGANRYAAEQMQARFLDQYESRIPIYKDFEVSDDLLRHRDVILIGRPESNSALAAWAAKIGLDYTGAAFRADGALHASEREALLLAAKNPLDASHMILVVAGNDALRTVKSWKAAGPADHVVFEDGVMAAAARGRRR
jgi:hypothetical protein